MRLFCDVDGSLADCEPAVTRYLLSKPKNWDAFYGALGTFAPIPEVITVVDSLFTQGWQVIFASGRRDAERLVTDTWLRKHTRVTDFTLLMRPAGDYRPAVQLKRPWWRTAQPDLVIEDDPETVAVMVKDGLTVLQVHGFRKISVEKRGQSSDMIPSLPQHKGG